MSQNQFDTLREYSLIKEVYSHCTYTPNCRKSAPCGFS